MWIGVSNIVEFTAKITVQICSVIVVAAVQVEQYDNSSASTRNTS